MRKAFAALILILVLGTGLTLSPQEATSYVTSTNNFLVTGENAEILPAVPITYKGTDYWVVAAASGSTINAYIPISDDAKEVATGDIAVRQLIESAIVLRKTQQYKTENSLNWHLSISNRNYFYTLSTAFTEMLPKVISVKTSLEQLEGTTDLANLAEDIQGDLEIIIESSNEIALQIDYSMGFEIEMLSEPDTNMVDDYESNNEEFFESMSNYKQGYNSLSLSLNTLKQGIGLVDSLTLNNRTALNQNLNLPAQTSKLTSFFNEMDTANQNMNAIFSATSRTETYIATLGTRIIMNDAWQAIYGADDDILEEDSRFETLEDAAESILSEDNAGIWIEEAEVDALRANWAQAKSRYESAKYETAKNSAKDAKKNALKILESGIKTTSNEIPQELIINAIIILVVLGIGLFIFEKYKEKKAVDETREDEVYDEYQ